MDRGGDVYDDADVLGMDSPLEMVDGGSGAQLEVARHAGVVDRRLQHLRISSRRSEKVVQTYHLGPEVGAAC